jgi:hypothetical protein
MAKRLRWKMTACALGALRVDSRQDQAVCEVVADTKREAKAQLTEAVKEHRAKLGAVYFIRIERVP